MALPGPKPAKYWQGADFDQIRAAILAVLPSGAYGAVTGSSLDLTSAGTLSLGCLIANQINIAGSGAPTDIGGDLTVEGNLNVYGSASTVGGPLVAGDGLNVSGGVCTVPAPVNATDAATKAYVDARSQYRARGRVSVTVGAPGTIGLNGTATNIASVSIQTNATIGSVRVARFTFSSAMPDGNYVVMVTREYNASGAQALAAQVVTVATGYFEVALYQTTTNGWYHIDNVANSFAVFVDR